MANVARLSTRQRAFVARSKELGTRLTGGCELTDEMLNEAYNLFVLQFMSDIKRYGEAELPGVGKFRLSKEAERTAVSPITGTTVIPAHTRVRYKSEKTIHRMVNGS